MLYQVIITVLLGLVFIQTIVNLCCLYSLRWRILKGKTDQLAEEQLPLISVLIPARNEENRIAPCLESLLQQDYPNYEIIVLEDRSEDKTREVCERVLAKKSESTIISGSDLPDGWVGKCWACHQLSQHAKGDWLLFTDADTWHAPNSLRASYELASSRNISLLSAWPLQITGSWSERLIIPLFYFLGFSIMGLWTQRLCLLFPKLISMLPEGWQRSLGGANGQYLFFSRSGYEAIGGHEVVSSHMVEDVALGREVILRSKEGLRLLNCYSDGLVRCRMYENFDELWEGFSKNLWPSFEKNYFGFISAGTFLFLTQVLPFVFLIYCPAQWKPLIGLQILLILMTRTLLTVRFRTALISLVAHPIGVMIGLVIGVRSWYLDRIGQLTWKGRVYKS